MKNISKTYQQLTTNHKPISINRNPITRDVTLFFSEPYSELGLNATDLSKLVVKVNGYWDQPDDVMFGDLNNFMILQIRPKYENILNRLLSMESLPTIILSILCQNENQFSTALFNVDQDQFLTISDYLFQLSHSNAKQPISYSAVAKYTIYLNVSSAHLNILNGVNEILWDNDVTLKGNQQLVYGLKHIWDHYDYPHIHVVRDYETHRLLLINAIRRTWLAMLNYQIGSKEPGSRINYGYASRQLLPKYSVDEYRKLANLSYGVVILPPYSETKIRQMTDKDIETLVLEVVCKNGIRPNLETIYMTTDQEYYEITLGNIPIDDRFTIVQPITYLGQLTLFNEFNGQHLPTGDSFEITKLLSRVEVQIIKGKTIFTRPSPSTAQIAFDYQNQQIFTDIIPTETYFDYLNYLRREANQQYHRSQLIRNIVPNGVNIETSSTEEAIIATVSLNKNHDGIDLSIPDQTVDVIFEETDVQFINDFDMSLNLLLELNSFISVLKVAYQTMNIVIVDPELLPVTFQKICRKTRIPISIYTYDGTIGQQIDSVFSSIMFSSTMIFITITEARYLSEFDQYNLFASSIRAGVYYSIEYLDFTPETLANAINTLIDSVMLITQQTSMKLTLTKTIINTMRVGVRVVFSLTDLPSITTAYPYVSPSSIRQFARVATYADRIIDPMSSKVYPSTMLPRVIPRIGSYIVVNCSAEYFNQALGYLSTLCRYTSSNAYGSTYIYYQITGIIDQSRIAIADRLATFLTNTQLKPSQLITKDITPHQVLSSKLTMNELVTQTDRIMLYLQRIGSNAISNPLSDYGSAQFTNIALTDDLYTMFDIDTVQIGLVPNVKFVPTLLDWGVPLPYTFGDVIIYNSIFMNPNATDDDLSIPIINMLSSTKRAKNVYFNLPFMNDVLYVLLGPLSIVTRRVDRYYLKLSTFPEIPCLNQTELNAVLATYPTPQYTIQMMTPSLLDYFYMSMIIQRHADVQTFYNSVVLHQVLPLFAISQD